MLTIKKYLIKEDENVRIVNNPGKSPLYEDGVFILARYAHNSFRIINPKRFRHLGLIVKSNNLVDFVAVDTVIFS